MFHIISIKAKTEARKSMAFSFLFPFYFKIYNSLIYNNDDHNNNNANNKTKN